MLVIRFASMSGPGTFGLRPEHLADMLRCNRRRAVNRLMQAIAETQGSAVVGTLPARSWSWIFDSRLIFVAKKTINVLRPIRVRESCGALYFEALAPQVRFQGATVHG